MASPNLPPPPPTQGGSSTSLEQKVKATLNWCRQTNVYAYTVPAAGAALAAASLVSSVATGGTLLPAVAAIGALESLVTYFTVPERNRPKARKGILIGGLIGAGYGIYNNLANSYNFCKNYAIGAIGGGIAGWKSVDILSKDKKKSFGYYAKRVGGAIAGAFGGAYLQRYLTNIGVVDSVCNSIGSHLRKYFLAPFGALIGFVTGYSKSKGSGNEFRNACLSAAVGAAAGYGLHTLDPSIQLPVRNVSGI